MLGLRATMAQFETSDVVALWAMASVSTLLWLLCLLALHSQGLA